MSFVYLDTSVALAHLLAEDLAPPERLWSESLISSRLLEYELWTRLHARKLAATHTEALRSLTGRVAMMELVSPVLERATEAFPVPVRTLDALHLASLVFLKTQAQPVKLASYDARMTGAAAALGIELYPL